MSASSKPKRPDAASMPAISPIDGSSGVVGVLRLLSAPVLSSRTGPPRRTGPRPPHVSLERTTTTPSRKAEVTGRHD
jgi:hypothetical protein